MAILLPKNLNKEKIFFLKKKLFSKAAKISLWFLFGAFLSLFLFASFLYLTYRQSYVNFVYMGVQVNGVDFGGKTKDEVRKYFAKKNTIFRQTLFTLTSPEKTATFSAKQINLGYDENLLASQAFSVGRSDNTFSNMSILLQAYMNGVDLNPAYRSDNKLDSLFLPLKQQIDVKPVDALFSFDKGKVVAFRVSKNGKAVDVKKLKQDIFSKMLSVMLSDRVQNFTMTIPIMVVPPTVATEKVNNLGIKELIAEGTSLFQHSIENRAFNINLAASRLNGILIPPGQVFSFVKTIGDVSSFTGYKQAYVIENGKTVLGDGGGLCQVSTTLFRAALAAGLPIIERNPHAYRVGYYEQDSPPGIDAAVYAPSVDLKFKNDTGNYILVQSFVDMNEYRLTFDLYGTKDDREVTINKPVILGQSPAPEPKFQDDPTLSKGEVKQVDFQADGANVFFTRTVKKENKIILSDKFVSNYRPWQAVFLKGTKE